MTPANKPEGAPSTLGKEDGAPPYDRAALIERACGDVELLAQIVDIYFETVPPLKKRLVEQLACRDAGAERTSHALAGMLLNLSANPAAKIALELESLTQTGKWDAARPLWQKLEVALSRLGVALTEEQSAAKGSQ